MMRKPRLDSIDVKILVELQRNGRVTNQRLSEVVGLSARPCLERVRRLEAAGLIRHYMAVLDPLLLPGMVTAFAEISLRSQGSSALLQFERRMSACPEVVGCYLVGGEFDYLAHIVCPSLERYNALTTTWIDDPELQVARMTSSFVLKAVRHFAGYPLDPERD